MEESVRDAADDEAALKQLLGEKAIAPNAPEADGKMGALVQGEAEDFVTPGATFRVQNRPRKTLN